MSNLLCSHGGGEPGGVDVLPAGTLVMTVDRLCRYVALTNASDTDMFIALHTSDDGVTSTAELNKGIMLLKNGGAYELNNTNMYYGEIWAIHGGTGIKRLCVQRGS